MDNYYGDDEMGGVEFAKELHALGFTRLCLFSAKHFTASMLPEYLTYINKMEYSQLKDWMLVQ